MPEESQNLFRYRILRYTPNLIRDEWVNVGVLLEGAAAGGDNGKSRARRAVRLIEESSELARVRRLHPAADEGLLRALAAEFEARLAAPESEVATYLEKLDQTLSNVLQFSPQKGVLAGDFDAELDRLFRDHVAPPPMAIVNRAPADGWHKIRSRKPSYAAFAPTLTLCPDFAMFPSKFPRSGA